MLLYGHGLCSEYETDYDDCYGYEHGSGYGSGSGYGGNVCYVSVWL